MRNLSGNNSSGQSNILVTAYIEEPDILQILVERLAECNYRVGDGLQQVPRDWQEIEFSSVEAIVSGRLIIAPGNGLIKIPFITCYLFSCTRSAKLQHNLTWQCSLS